MQLAVATLAAGGFSPHPQSIMGYRNDTVTWIVTLFMFLAGGNYALQYRVLFQRNFGRSLHNEELRLYAVIVVVVSLALCLALVRTGPGLSATDCATGCSRSFRS